MPFRPDSFKEGSSTGAKIAGKDIGWGRKNLGFVRSGMRTSCWIAFLLTFCIDAVGQPITMSDLSRAREALSRVKGLTDSEKREISGLYEQAGQSLQQEIRFKAQQIGHTRTKRVIQAELTKAQSASTLRLSSSSPPPPSETSQEVEEETARVRNDRASHVRMRDELSKLQTNLRIRSEEITIARASIRESIQSIEDEIAVLPLASPSLYWEKASRTALQARRQALEQEFQTLATEHEAIDLRRRLIPLQKEAHLLGLEADDQLLSELTLRKARARIKDARESIDRTLAQARAISGRFSELSAIAGDIATLATALWGDDGAQAKSDRAALQTEEMSASFARFKEITANTVRRYQNAGLFSPASEWWPAPVERFGSLSEVRLALLNLYTAEVAARRDVFRMEEDRAESTPLETQVQQLLAISARNPGDAEFDDLKTRARSILELRRGLKIDLLTESRAYVTRLGEASRVGKELLLSIQGLQLFALQHVLWARSVSGPILPSAKACGNALLWFSSYRNWAQIIAGFNVPGVHRFLWCGGFIAVCLLFLFRRSLRTRLERSFLEHAQPGRTRELLFSIVASLVSALPAPLLLAYVGWMIGAVGDNVDLGRAIAAGARYTARFLYLTVLVSGMLANGAVTDRLLGWSAEVRRTLDWGARMLSLVCTPLFFIAAALAHDGMFFGGEPALQSYHDSLGRLCFMIAALHAFVVWRTVLNRSGAVAKAIGNRLGKPGIMRMRMARFTCNLVLLSAFLLALFGFYTTAYLLIQNLVRTAVLTVILALVSALIRQWRLSQERRLTAVTTSSEAEERNRKADEQVRRLSRFGLTLVWIVGALIIWSVALPTLSLLKNVELLPEFKITVDRTLATVATRPVSQERSNAEKQESTPSPATVPTPGTRPDQPVQAGQPLYLSDLLLAIFVGSMAIMLARNIPGLLYFTVLRRLRLDEGGQYAVTTITRYLVVMAGMIAVSGILGVNWSKVQWLAAALTFGIGFGLQEIFANFASGLILLLDRSIRVGDAVSVGTLSGVVARIQMRATTVTLWDHSDMVVPNKEFITSKLVNWTLSHPETRVDLKVAVDYGSNLEQVREVLMRLAEEHPAVLKDPAPQVLLTEFGESAILFELRVFGLYSYGRPVLLDELHRAVVREFRRLEIVIASPKLDVRLNSVAMIHNA